MDKSDLLDHAIKEFTGIENIELLKQIATLRVHTPDMNTASLCGAIVRLLILQQRSIELAEEREEIYKRDIQDLTEQIGLIRRDLSEVRFRVKDFDGQ